MRYLCPTGVESVSVGGASYSPVTLSNGHRIFDFPDGKDYNSLLPGWVQYHSVFPEPLNINNVAGVAAVVTPEGEDVEPLSTEIPQVDPRENNPVDNASDNVLPDEQSDTSLEDELLGHVDSSTENEAEGLLGEVDTSKKKKAK